uniref:Bifunctional inhibitor/plant lipid transfer protein/seed storage helical domain-containing protein n=1 Tax=Arundo donax TaxID=35708 RepID=A0A0A8Y4A3_ARUDO
MTMVRRTCQCTVVLVALCLAVAADAALAADVLPAACGGADASSVQETCFQKLKAGTQKYFDKSRKTIINCCTAVSPDCRCEVKRQIDQDPAPLECLNNLPNCM